VREHATAFSERVASISGGSAGQVEYEASVGLPADAIDAENVSAVEAAFHEQLERAGEREQRRGMTLVGPHRDDLRIRGERENAPGEWVDLRTYGSGGQQRTAAVALRMIEAETLKSASGEEPVILLDDVFAELDPGRSMRILAWVREEEGGQVILTAPKPSDLERRGIGVVPWSIRSGVVSPL
jgi:DNA replication and repair protein RecF